MLMLSGQAKSAPPSPSGIMAKKLELSMGSVMMGRPLAAHGDTAPPAASIRVAKNCSAEAVFRLYDHARITPPFPSGTASGRN